ncbi:MAG: right-handed parallel beta-helix repeat-containing protein, partial [Armatimonadota bacterium]|nr:right-handed parallel beta-helix repeat-containing protein [Armatimonadota bacterium]
AVCLLGVMRGANAAPSSITVGDPKKPDMLAQAVQDAYKNGARRIVIKPGLYLLPNVGRAAFRLDGWKDATVSAYGATLIISDLAWTHDVFDLNNCTNVTLEGPTLSQTAVTAYQGRVVAVGKDAAGKATCDFRPDAGYPVPPADPKGFLGGGINVVDAHTRLLKVGVGDFYGVPAEALGDGTFRVHFSQPTLNFGVGDWLVGRYGNAPFKVYLGDSRNCTIKDVTMMRNGFAPIREDGGGGNRYLHCVWALGPRPAGATEDPLVTNAADGMHMIGSRPGPDIENCVFQGIFLDDCIAIHGGFATVKSASGKTLTLENGGGGQAVGEPVRISGEKGFFGEATVTALKDNGDKTTTLTLDKDLSIPPGVKLSDPLRDGAGYKIIGCHLGNTRSRGILVKSDNGLIQNNTIEGCGMSAVSIGPEYAWGEADYAHHVWVEGNIIRRCGGATYGGQAIFVHGDGAMGNEDITIKNNAFISNFQGDIDINWTNGALIAHNILTGPAHWPVDVKPHSPVSLANSRGITLKGNIVKNTSAYAPLLVSPGANLANVVGNDTSGLTAAPSATGAVFLHDGSPTDTNIVYVGRWDRGDAKVYHSYWGGAYLRAKFTGTSIGFQGGSTAGGPNVMASVDGEPLHEVSALKVQGLKPGTHTLLLGAPNQNSEFDFKGLTLDQGATTLPVPIRPIIEFVGDSITTGGGQTLPGTVNYAWMTAETLGADHAQIAFSARALTTGFGCAGDKAGLDTQYFRLKNFNHLDDKPQAIWDFSYAPRLVVINLGQNDQCG